jgi:large subunit ribosomal protein L22
MPVSPFKVRKYAQLFKGKGIEEARAILSYHPSPTCDDLLRLLNSAVANAENNHEFDPELMEVKNVLVDGAMTHKRWRPRARGRVNRIRKRTSHVLIEIDLKEEFKVKPPAEAEEPVEEKQPRRAAKKARKETVKAPVAVAPAPETSVAVEAGAEEVAEAAGESAEVEPRASVVEKENGEETKE